MKCLVCGSEELETLKVKTLSSKSKEINELLLKCNDCGSVFKDSISLPRPIAYRLIISENDTSKKTFINICPKDTLKSGDVLLSDLGQVEVSSLELKSGKRVESSIASDVLTIWATSLEIPTRIGLSVNLERRVQSYKVDLERDFRIEVDDVIRIDEYTGKVHGIKTNDRKMDKGGAIAAFIKRVYLTPVNFKNYDYDLTNNIAVKKIKKEYKKGPKKDPKKEYKKDPK